MGYNGGKRVWPQRNSGFSKSSLRFGNKMIKKAVLPAMKLGSSALGLTSSRKGTYRRKQNYNTDYYKNAINTVGRFDERYDLQIDKNNGLDSLGVFFLVITIILFVLAFADILWFGFCYFFGSISFTLSVISFSLDRIAPTAYKNEKIFKQIYPLFIIGILEILVGILPFNIYGELGTPLLYLDVDSSSPAIIVDEAIIIVMIGLALFGWGVYLCLRGNK